MPVRVNDAPPVLSAQAESSAVQSMGHAKAEARARAEAAQIEMQGMLEQVLPSLTH
jgi:hypothetical protein